MYDNAHKLKTLIGHLNTHYFSFFVVVNIFDRTHVLQIPNLV